MTWMILIFAIFSAQGGIHRDQLFALQDELLNPPPVIQQSDPPPVAATPSPTVAVIPSTGKQRRGSLSRP